LGGIHSAHRSFTLPAKHTGALSAHSGSRRRDPGVIRQGLGTLWARSGRIPARAGAIRAHSGRLFSTSWRIPGAFRLAQARSGHALASSGQILGAFRLAQPQSGRALACSGHTLGALRAHSGSHRRAQGTSRQNLSMLWALSGGILVRARFHGVWAHSGHTFVKAMRNYSVSAIPWTYHTNIILIIRADLTWNLVANAQITYHHCYDEAPSKPT